MKFTNKILDIVTTAIMKKVDRKKEEFKESEEYEVLLEAEKRKRNYPEMVAAQLTLSKAKEKLDKARKVADDAQVAFRKISTDNHYNFGWGDPTCPSAIDSKISEMAMRNATFPSAEEVQTAIIFANDSDIAAVEQAVSQQFNL